MGSNIEEVDAIVHPATVKEVFPARNIVIVSVNDEDECGGCPAARLCGISGAKENRLEIKTPMACRFSPGEKVIVCGTEKMHHKAVMLATVIPCIAMIAIMTLVFLITFDQLIAALAGISSMILFFILLYSLRNKVAHEFSFTIRKDDQ